MAGVLLCLKRPRYEDVVLSDLPVGYWPCNEEVGPYVRDVVGGLHGTLQPGVIPGGFAFPGGGKIMACRGPQITRWVTIPDNASLSFATTMTMEAWSINYRLSDNNNGMLVFGKGWNANPPYQHYEWGLDYYLAAGYRSSQMSSSTPGSSYSQAIMGVSGGGVSRLCHLVGTWDPSGTQTALWVNGVRLGYSTTTTGTRAYDTAGIGGMGGFVDGLNGAYTIEGAIGHCATYNYVLSPSRIMAHYQAGIGMRYELNGRQALVS